MNNLEFEGKNLRLAIQNACEELSLTEVELDYNIITKGSKGFLSFGAKKAKISVNLDSSKQGAMSLVDEAFGYEKKGRNNNRKKPPVKVPEYADVPLNIGMESLEKIVDLITDGTKITLDRTVDPVVYRIEGGNSALMIGRRGQTLEAIQYIVDKIVNKNSTERVRVLVDVEGYLESRKENLQSLAYRLAEKAKRTGKPSTISQMTAHDRRIVHLTLKDDRGVRTQSMGDGFYRRLVIFPKRNNYKKKKQFQKRN
ncbi:MAG: protein jag [Proteobacteria bacterium]|nr:protein jag [Pseudomonadota bacterium]